MATVRFITDTQPVPSSNPIEVIQANESFLQFLHAHDNELGELHFPVLSYVPNLWEHLTTLDGEEVVELDADHDFNYLRLDEPKYYWFLIGMIEKYESENPRKVVLDCDFQEYDVPERKAK